MHSTREPGQDDKIRAARKKTAVESPPAAAKALQESLHSGQSSRVCQVRSKKKPAAAANATPRPLSEGNCPGQQVADLNCVPGPRHQGSQRPREERHTLLVSPLYFSPHLAASNKASSRSKVNAVCRLIESSCEARCKSAGQRAKRLSSPFRAGVPASLM